MTWCDPNVRPSERDVRHVQKPHGIFGRYRQPPHNWSDRDAVKTALREMRINWTDAVAIAKAGQGVRAGR